MSEAVIDEEDFLGKPLDDVPTIEPDEKCNGRKYEKQDDGPNLFTGYCRNVAGKATEHLHEGRCSNHGGSSKGAPEKNQNAVGNGGGAPLENTNAFRHGAFSDRFMDQLSDKEQDSLVDLVERLGQPESAKETGIMIAAEAYHKYLRSADDRFLARFESLCKTFGIAEDEVMRHLHAHQHQHEVSGSIDHELTNQERADLNAIVDSAAAGPAEIEVEPLSGLADGDEEIIDAVSDESDESDESESPIEVNW